MDRKTARNLFLPSFSLFAILTPAILPAQQSAAAPAAEAPPLQVAAPAWQKGDYWATFDHKLLVDFADLAHYHDADAQLPPPAAGENRVVFMGDSITEGWKLQDSFPGKPYVNRGISGQTTSQMLLRFRPDVVNLKPKVVVILGGTNDLAENTGPVTLEQIENNLGAMADLASANGIRVVMCSVVPTVRYWWHPGSENPAPKIAELNKWIKSYAAEKNYPYVDYFSAMADKEGGLPKNLSPDGVHPTAAGHAIMAPLVEAAIEKALK